MKFSDVLVAKGFIKPQLQKMDIFDIYNSFLLNYNYISFEEFLKIPIKMTFKILYFIKKNKKRAILTVNAGYLKDDSEVYI